MGICIRVTVLSLGFMVCRVEVFWVRVVGSGCKGQGLWL